jgi:DNA topoisomerase IB
LEGFPREKVLAVMMRLINSLYIRVGTEKSVKQYKTYGITTLQNRHLSVERGGNSFLISSANTTSSIGKFWLTKNSPDCCAI